jgi:hypothetical protein
METQMFIKKIFKNGKQKGVYIPVEIAKQMKSKRYYKFTVEEIKE